MSKMQFSKLYGVSRTTVDKRIADGSLRTEKILKTTYIDISDQDEIDEALRKRSPSEWSRGETHEQKLKIVDDLMDIAYKQEQKTANSADSPPDPRLKELAMDFTSYKGFEKRKIKVKNGFPKYRHGFPYFELTIDDIPGIELSYLEDPALFAKTYPGQIYPFELVTRLKELDIIWTSSDNSPELVAWRNSKAAKDFYKKYPWMKARQAN